MTVTPEHVALMRMANHIYVKSGYVFGDILPLPHLNLRGPQYVLPVAECRELAALSVRKEKERTYIHKRSAPNVQPFVVEGPGPPPPEVVDDQGEILPNVGWAEPNWIGAAENILMDADDAHEDEHLPQPHAVYQAAGANLLGVVHYPEDDKYINFENDAGCELTSAIEDMVNVIMGATPVLKYNFRQIQEGVIPQSPMLHVNSVLLRRAQEVIALVEGKYVSEERVAEILCRIPDSTIEEFKKDLNLVGGSMGKYSFDTSTGQNELMRWWAKGIPFSYLPIIHETCVKTSSHTNIPNLRSFLNWHYNNIYTYEVSKLGKSAIINIGPHSIPHIPMVQYIAPMSPTIWYVLFELSKVMQVEGLRTLWEKINMMHVRSEDTPDSPGLAIEAISNYINKWRTPLREIPIQEVRDFHDWNYAIRNDVSPFKILSQDYTIYETNKLLKANGIKSSVPALRKIRDIMKARNNKWYMRVPRKEIPTKIKMRKYTKKIKTINDITILDMGWTDIRTWNVGVWIGNCQSVFSSYETAINDASKAISLFALADKNENLIAYMSVFSYNGWLVVDSYEVHSFNIDIAIRFLRTMATIILGKHRRISNKLAIGFPSNHRPREAFRKLSKDKRRRLEIRNYKDSWAAGEKDEAERPSADMRGNFVLEETIVFMGG